eukprot:gene19941-26649_t
MLNPKLKIYSGGPGWQEHRSMLLFSIKGDPTEVTLWETKYTSEGQEFCSGIQPTCACHDDLPLCST